MTLYSVTDSEQPTQTQRTQTIQMPFSNVFKAFRQCSIRGPLVGQRRGKSQKKSKTSSSFSMENCQAQCCSAIGASKDSTGTRKLETWARFCREPSLMLELYENYDCHATAVAIRLAIRCCWAENQDYLSRILLHTFPGYLRWIPLVHFGGIPTSMCFMTVNH